MSDTDPPVLYQESLSGALADVTVGLRQQGLDPLRYLVDIDAGLAMFAPRDTHQIRVTYNHRSELSMEATVPHEWLVAPKGSKHDQLIAAISELVSALKSKVEASGRPL